MGRSSLKQKAAPRGILKKEGAAPKPKRNIVFKDGFVADAPRKFSKPKALTTVANDLEQENFRQVWREVSSKKLDYAARILQQFARKFMLCWILTNDRRTELYEELDYIAERLEGDLERLEWEKEDMQQEAELEVQAERESGAAPEEVSRVAAQLKAIKSMQAEIRSLRQDNAKLKRDSKELKKENKQLGYDLKEKSPAVEMGKHKIENLERSHCQYKKNHDQYLPNIKKWQDSIDQITEEQYKCQRQGVLYRNACLNILHAVRQRYPRKRVLNPIREIMGEEFIKYHAIPASDEEYEEPAPPPPPPALYRHTSAPLTASNTTGGTNTHSPKDKKNFVRKYNTDGKVGLKNKPFDADDDDEQEDMTESHRSVQVREDASERHAADETPVETENGKKEKKERRKSNKHSADDTEDGKKEKKERRKSHKKKHKHKDSKRKSSKKGDELSGLPAGSGDNTESETEADPIDESAKDPAAPKVAPEETTTATEVTIAAAEDSTAATEETMAVAEDTAPVTQETMTAKEETTPAKEEPTAVTEETTPATEPTVAAEAVVLETTSVAEGPTAAAQAKAAAAELVAEGPSEAAEGEAPVPETEGPKMAAEEHTSKPPAEGEVVRDPATAEEAVTTDTAEDEK
jgi:hypothetical protein